MKTDFTLTTVALATIDLGDLVDASSETVVGIGLFSSCIESQTITFTIDTVAIAPTDFAGDLIGWLDNSLPDKGILAGYGLQHELPRLLGRLPGSADSPAVGALAGELGRPRIDVRGPRGAKDGKSLIEACRAADIPISRLDSEDRFNAWCFGRTEVFEQSLQTDAIAVWRLLFDKLGAMSDSGADTNRQMAKLLDDWLGGEPGVAALIHRTPRHRR